MVLSWYRLTGWLLEWSSDSAPIPTNCFLGLQSLSCLLWPLCWGRVLLVLFLSILLFFITFVTSPPVVAFAAGGLAAGFFFFGAGY